MEMNRFVIEEAARRGITRAQVEDEINLNLAIELSTPADVIVEEEEEDNTTINTINEENDKNNNEPLTIFSLSLDVISIILSQFLTIFDVSKLDVAYCNRNYRSRLLSILSNNDYIRYDHIHLDNNLGRKINNAMIWLGKR